MAGFVNQAENATLDAWFGSQVLGPATWYVGLMTVGHDDTGTGGTEATGNNYSRIDVVNDATNFPDAANGQKQNGAPISSDESTGAWGQIVQIAFFEVLSGGVPQFIFDIPVGPNRQNIDGAQQVWEMDTAGLTLTLD